GDVLPGAVIVLLRPTSQHFNVSDRLAVHAVEARVRCDTSINANLCICHVVFLLHKRNPNQDWLGLDSGIGLILGIGHEAGTYLSSDTASFFLVAEVAAQVLHSVHPYERLPPVVRLVPVDSANS